MTGTGAEYANEPQEAQQPDRTSLRARILTPIIRLVVKRWPRGNAAKLIRRARLLFGIIPRWLSFTTSYEVSYQQVQGTDICGEWVTPDANYFDDKVLLYLHGGGYVSCSPQSHRAITSSLARLLNCRIFALDYRLAPEAPFP